MRRSSKKKKIMIFLTIVIALALLYPGWLMVQFLDYEVSEEELGVEEDFFVFEPIIHLQTNQDDNNDIVLEEEHEQEEESNQIGNHTIEGEKSSIPPQRKEKQTKPSEMEKVTHQPVVKTLSVEERVKQTKDIYYPQFVQLQNKAMERLQQLLLIAKKEYKETKDQESFSEQEFATKYIAAAKKLQTGVDQVFYQLVDQMELDLKNKNLPLNLVNEAKVTYKETIKSQKAELLKQFLN